MKVVGSVEILVLKREKLRKNFPPFSTKQQRSQSFENRPMFMPRTTAFSRPSPKMKHALQDSCAGASSGWRGEKTQKKKKKRRITKTRRDKSRGRFHRDATALRPDTRVAGEKERERERNCPTYRKETGGGIKRRRKRVDTGC